MKKLSVVALVLAAVTACPADKATKGELVTPDAGPAVVTPDPMAAKPAVDPKDTVSKTAIGALPMASPVLIVDDMTYTRADLERAIAQHAASTGMPPDGLNARIRDALEQPAYEKLLDRHLISAEAKRRGMWPDEAAVRAEKEKILRSMPPAMTIEGFYQKLGTDDAGFSKEIAIDMALSKLFEALQKEQKQPDEAVLRKVYEENKARFKAPELASASHILIKLEPGSPQAEVAAATARAEELRKEVAGKDKATFAKVALAKSDDPGAKNNKGDLGKFPRGAMVKPLDDIAFSLKDGEISQVVRSDFGLHIVRGQGITPPGQMSYADVKPTIAQREGGKLFVESLDAMVNGLRKKAKVQRLVEPAKSELGGMPGAATPPGGDPLGMPPAPMPAPPVPPPAPPVNVPPGGNAG